MDYVQSFRLGQEVETTASLRDPRGSVGTDRGLGCQVSKRLDRSLHHSILPTGRPGLFLL